MIFLKGIRMITPQTEPKKKITLYQALPNKIEKIEYILQKGVEIGIGHFIFFRSDRSQKLVLSDSKIARFHVIAQEAVEQCGGLILPKIEIRETSPDLDRNKANIVLDTIGKKRQLSEFHEGENIGIWVGPEGGWSMEERKKMEQNGSIFAHFSERVMRTETAGVVVAFALLNL